MDENHESVWLHRTNTFHDKDTFENLVLKLVYDWLVLMVNRKLAYSSPCDFLVMKESPG